MRKSLVMMGTASALALAVSTSAFAGTVDGRVTDASESIGLEGAIVRVVETGQTATVERDGSFRISGLAAGQYTLRVSYVGADPREITVDLASANDTVTPVITLGDDVSYVENILVVGQRGAMNSALNRQRANDGFVTVLSSDAIGQFPDENVAEAARRAVGVNVLNDQGEGRFVSIRGADPNLVSTSVNGVRLTSPEAEDRQVGLDVIDADVLSGVVINKSLLPNMDADSVGGNVEIETQSGLDVDGMTLRGRVAGLYSEQEDEFGGRFSLNYANNFMEGRFGVAASYSYQERVFGSENIEVDDGWDEDGGVWFPKEMELRNYEVTRERTTAAINLDYRHSNSLSFFSRTLFSDFSDQEYRSRVEVKFEDGDFDAGQSTPGLAVFTASEFGVDRDIKDRLETQRIFATDIGGEWLDDATTVDWSLSYVYSEEEEPNRLDTDFKAEFDSGETFAVDTSNPLRPALRFGNGLDSQAFYDPANYELDEFETVNGISMDREIAAQVNVRHDFNLSNWTSYIQYGVRARNRDKKFDAEIGIFELDGIDRTLADFPNQVEFELETIGTTPHASAVRSFFESAATPLERDDFDSQRDSLVEDYRFSEDVTAGYLMASMDNGPLRIVGGVRMEQTDMQASGFRVFEAEEDATVGGIVLGDDTLFLGETATSDDYTDVLPSVNVRYELNENLIARFAYYGSIQRPNPGQVAPRVFIEQNDSNDVEAEFGNPALQRLEAENFDLALEWYPNNDSVISLGYFRKDLENAITGIRVENGTVNGIAFDEGSTFANLASGEISGWELNYQQELNWLYDGLIAGFNYTAADSETVLPDGRTVALPRQSDTVWNAILGYDDGPWDLRLAYSSRSEYIDEVRLLEDPTDPVEDRIVLDHAQLDFSAKFNLTDNLQLFGEVKNITDEPFVAVTRPDGIDRLEQFEQYGWSTVFGVRFTY